VLAGASPTSTTSFVAAPAPPRPTAPEGWDDLDEVRAVSLVSAFNLDELHELRRHEVEHGFRQPVIAEIDQRIATIVDLRRRAGAGADADRPLRAR
jgi:hypothetical protein